jgi:uncharacterized membrane protein YdjX (TVP38/TMEM64 family)
LVLNKREAAGISSNKRNHIWIKVLLLLLIIAGLTFALYESGLVHLFMSKRRMESLLTSLGRWSFVGFIFLQAFQVIAAPIPGDATGLLGGYLYGPMLGTILSTLGLTLGSYAAFGLSRSLGRPFVEKFVASQTMERFDFLLHHKGAFLVFLLFLIPGFPKDYLCYMLGLGHLSTLEFLVIGGTGRLFGTVLLTLGGSYIKLHQYGRFFILLGAALIILLLAMAYKDRLETFFRHLHRRSRSKEKKKYQNGIV